MATRAEHRRATLLRLSDAAIDLIEADGPGVTIEAIAERAGLSRRTAFRYVDGKEELAFLHPVMWFDVFDAALAAGDRSGPFPERLWHASAAIADHVDADPERPRRAFVVAAGHPELHRGFATVFGRWVDRITEEVQQGPDPVDPFRARIIGSAVMGMVDAVTREWVFSPPGRSYRDVCRQGFEVIEPVLALNR